jgi:serine protease Do
MQPSRRKCLFASLAVLLFFLLASRALAETLSVTSTPSGATVEIEGIVVGITPCKINYPGGYFHKTKTVFGERLEHSLTARVYKAGYLPREVTLTEGPLEWVALNGKDHGRYWLMKTNQIQLNLEESSAVFTGSPRTVSAAAASDLKPALPPHLPPELPAEKVVEMAGPAVVKLQAGDEWGTGFLITDTGVIATNAHVARKVGTLDAIFANGAKLLAKVVYVDTRFDLALVKVDGRDLPHLALSDLSDVRAGETVIAIGNPSQGMPNTVTRGIISAVGHDEHKGSGTWIQTDAAINPGNSGGPLLDLRGDVLGINTQKEFISEDARPLEGIGFALSAADLIEVLHRFYPEAVAVSPSPQSIATSGVAQAPPALAGTGSVAVISDPVGAEIWVDGKFVGQTPSTIPLPAGSHRVEVKANGAQVWSRDLDVLGDSQVTLHPVLATSTINTAH